MAYESKDSQVRSRQLKVQKVSIPFQIVGSATPAAKVLTSDEPSLLFLAVEGIDNITVASGALNSDDTVPTLASAADATGIFSVLVRIQEQVEKVVSAKVSCLSSADLVTCTLPSAPASGIVAGGALDKIVLNVDSGLALTSGTRQLCLELEYVVAEDA